MSRRCSRRPGSTKPRLRRTLSGPSARVQPAETAVMAVQPLEPACDAGATSIARPKQGQSTGRSKEPSQCQSQWLCPTFLEPTSARQLAPGSEARSSSDGCAPCAVPRPKCAWWAVRINLREGSWFDADALATLIVWLHNERFNARDGSRRCSITFRYQRTSARCPSFFCGALVAREGSARGAQPMSGAATGADSKVIESHPRPFALIEAPKSTFR